MVQLVHAGRNPVDLAREFRCSAQASRNWAAQAVVDSGKVRSAGCALTTPEREELTRMRRQARQVQTERGIVA
jgi:transposase